MLFADYAGVFPFVLLIAGWLAFLPRKPMAKVWASGAATLLSLPIGLHIIELVALPPSWAPNYGDHSPGVGLAFGPLVTGWVLCVLVWTTLMGVTVARQYRSKNST